MLLEMVFDCVMWDFLDSCLCFQEMECIHMESPEVKRLEESMGDNGMNRSINQTRFNAGVAGSMIEG